MIKNSNEREDLKGKKNIKLDYYIKYLISERDEIYEAFTHKTKRQSKQPKRQWQCSFELVADYNFITY